MTKVKSTTGTRPQTWTLLPKVQFGQCGAKEKPAGAVDQPGSVKEKTETKPPEIQVTETKPPEIYVLMEMWTHVTSKQHCPSSEPREQTPRYQQSATLSLRNISPFCMMFCQVTICSTRLIVGLQMFSHQLNPTNF